MVDELKEYLENTYSPKVESPWDKYPEHTTFKHTNNNKWFALIMKIGYNKLDQKKSGEVFVINLKCIPDMIGSLRKKEGIYKAYHMNKEHWITVVLDGTVSISEIKSLIDISFELTIK